jgi:hypothetical protein
MSGQGKSIVKVKRELRETRDEAIKGFINNLTYLVKAALTKNKDDEDLKRRADEFNIAKQEAPEGVLKISGPPIWDYRDDIKAGNVDRFLKSDFKEDIVKYSDRTIPNEDLIEDDQILIEKVKRSWHLLTPQEQEMMKKKVQGMVGYYAQYLSCVRKLRELGETTS